MGLLALDLRQALAEETPADTALRRSLFEIYSRLGIAIHLTYGMLENVAATVPVVATPGQAPMVGEDAIGTNTVTLLPGVMNKGSTVEPQNFIDNLSVV